MLSLVPDLWGLLPRPLRRDSIATILVGAAVGYKLLVALERRSKPGPLTRRAHCARLWLDRATARVFPVGLTALVGLGCVGLLLTWLPHYLTWPWCRDVDCYAMLALGWERGILPYRDVRAYNFPGHIYLHWLLGKVTGWGGTVPFYALDAAAVVGLGLALVFWSRRRLGGALPGLVGYVGFLMFYLGLEFEQVAERDWHATLLASLALLAAETWPGRRGRLGAAGALALAMIIRPHTVLFLPAVACAVVEGATRESAARGVAWRALGSWSLWLSLGLLLGFAPVLLAGIGDDLAASLRIAAYGGPYSQATGSSMRAAFLDPFRTWRTWAVLAGLLGTAAFGPSSLRRSARTWTVAWLGALIYAPLHPVQHAYLAHPRELVGSIALGLPVAWLVTSTRLASPLRLLAILLVLHEAMPTVPRFCLPTASLRSLGPLVRGEEPMIPPPGSGRFFKAGNHDYYPWDDYCAVLDYIRRTTSPETFVANVLRHVPFPPVNGPTGRPSPFLAESGICWMWLVSENRDEPFAAELERATDSVVVWCPAESRTEPRLRLPRLTSVILRLYRPSARFGRIEVWRRKTEAELSRGRGDVPVESNQSSSSSSSSSSASGQDEGGTDRRGHDGAAALDGLPDVLSGFNKCRSSPLFDTPKRLKPGPRRYPIRRGPSRSRCQCLASLVHPRPLLDDGVQRLTVIRPRRGHCDRLP